VTTRPLFSYRLIAPRHWLTWIGFGLWWLLAQLPHRSQMWLGKLLGKLISVFAGRRIAIAKRNLELCFPHYSDSERDQILQGFITSMGRSFFETGIAWFATKSRIRALHSVEGLEHLHEAEKNAEGVLLVAMHFSHLDLGAAAFGCNHALDGSYRTHKNAVFDYVQALGRQRYNKNGLVIARGDVRTMVKRLRAGHAIWYAPDQDYGEKHSVFVPFFGIPAATITATSQLAKLGRAAVIPYTYIRDEQTLRYKLVVHPRFENFPGGDDIADANTLNRFIEACVLEAPEQYLWAHRRFKSRPPGEADVYQSVGIAAGKRR